MSGTNNPLGLDGFAFADTISFLARSGARAISGALIPVTRNG